jgi:Asp-tRNA(Asn)/Glu-tRNA(Gln) amidotransferase A subunit family amidase
MELLGRPFDEATLLRIGHAFQTTKQGDTVP